MFAIGIMSGTSLDGVDIGLIEWDVDDEISSTLGATFPFEPQLLADLKNLIFPNSAEHLEPAGRIDLIKEIMRLDHALGKFYADCVERFLTTQSIRIDDIAVIGCHGQTIRHEPDSLFTSWQIGDANCVAARLGIPVANDFRRLDMACGGQGAPLAPQFHAAWMERWLKLKTKAKARSWAWVNIGGISNVSKVGHDNQLIGYDCGPGNALCDAWIQKHKNLPMDKDGAWAESGMIIPELLDCFWKDPFFHLDPPKSTGRGYFGLAWLETKIGEAEKKKEKHILPQDVQRTLVALTAKCICSAVELDCLPLMVVVSGGGVHNSCLMGDLEQAVQGKEIQFMSSLGLGCHPDYVEAICFAWYGRQRLERVPLTLNLGGHRKAIVHGALYHP